MATEVMSGAAKEQKPGAPAWRFRGWVGGCVLLGMLYLMPLSWPGERVALVIGLSLFWAGVIAAFRSYRGLRLLSIAVALLCFFPVRTGTIRLLLLLGLAALWIAAWIVFRQQRRVTATLLAGVVVAVGLLGMPGRASDPAALREEYVRSLQGFTGTNYIWGGENGLGIDCSGLIRCGWMDANLRLGLRTLNPDLLRQAARLWFQDCSAKELGEGYRNRTLLIGSTPALNRLAAVPLQQGDLAVTQSGLHILAYLGDRRWIEADPLAGKVIVVETPAPQNPWFESPMKIVRWRTAE